MWTVVPTTQTASWSVLPSAQTAGWNEINDTQNANWSSVSGFLMLETALPEYLVQESGSLPLRFKLETTY